MKKKKIVALGGGSGLSSLLIGLKKFPVDITAVVSVCDDGSSTGKLRKEFKIPAVGDIRKVIASLSETDELMEELLNYRFKTTSDLNGHTVGNLMLTALSNITGNMSDGIEVLSSVLNLKGHVLPLTEDNAILMAKMKDGKIIEGEHNITDYNGAIKRVYYKNKVKVNPKVIESLKEADLIIFSMGSLFTSIIPDLLCKEIVKTIDEIKTPIMYVCNMMTQPGETDKFKVSDHVKLLNSYLGKRKIDIVVVNNGEITEPMVKKYETKEKKDPVIYDKDETKKIVKKVIVDDFIDESTGILRHNALNLGFYIFRELEVKSKLNK